MAKELVTFDRPTAEAVVDMLKRDVPNHNNTPHGRRHRWVSSCSCVPPTVGKIASLTSTPPDFTSYTMDVVDPIDLTTVIESGVVVSNPMGNWLPDDTIVQSDIIYGSDGTPYFILGYPDSTTGTMGQATTTITARDGDTMGSGTVEFQTQSGSTLTDSGVTVTAFNPYAQPFASGDFAILGWDGTQYTISGMPTDTTTSSVPAPAGELFGTTWPASFPVEGVGWTDNGCASSSLLNVRKTVNFAGEVYKSGNPYYVWESADDVFESPGVCSGIFDDKKFFVWVQIINGWSGVHLFNDDKLFTDSYTTGGGSPGSVSYQYTTASTTLTFGDSSTYISHTLSSVYNTSDVTHGTVRLHPYGT